MKHLLHGKHHHTIVLHGGPGAVGSAHGLAKLIGNCVELHSYGQTLEEQFEEIDQVISAFEMSEITLVGHSWGAWLAYLYAASHQISKIVLIGCGALEAKYLNSMNSKRESRLTDQEQEEANQFMADITSGKPVEDMTYFGKLMSKMDSYDMAYFDDLSMGFDFVGHQQLMQEINSLRDSGELLALGQKIKSEVVIIHGADDPHPIDGVIEPLQKIGLEHKAYILEKCGHAPWHERYGRKPFEELIQRECRYLMMTKRLGLRRFTEDDVKWFYEMNMDPEVMQYFPSVLDATASEAFLKKIISHYKQHGFGLYAVEILSTQKPIGFTGLSVPQFEANFMPCVEIGWRLMKSYWHHGYAREGAKAVLQYGFEILKLPAVVSFTATLNKPSIKVMKAIGMHQVKTFNHPKVKGSVLEAHVLYEIEAKNRQENHLK